MIFCFSGRIFHIVFVWMGVVIYDLVRAHTGMYYEYNSSTFQGLLKASPTVFKDLKLMKKRI